MVYRIPMRTVIAILRRKILRLYNSVILSAAKNLFRNEMFRLRLNMTESYQRPVVSYQFYRFTSDCIPIRYGTGTRMEAQNFAPLLFKQGDDVQYHLCCLLHAFQRHVFHFTMKIVSAGEDVWAWQTHK